MTPAQVLDGHTWAEFYAIWLRSGEQRKQHNPQTIREKIDRLRAKKGLPPSTGWPEER